jgi:transposase
MKAYSLDLRERIVQAVDGGQSAREVAERFAVGVTTVRRFVQRAAAADLAPRVSPGRPRMIDPELTLRLTAQLEAHPDATLAEHCQRWAAEQGVRLSPATLSRAITRLGWTRKKRPSPPVNATRMRVSPGERISPNGPPTAWSSSMSPAPTRR